MKRFSSLLFLVFAASVIVSSSAWAAPRNVGRFVTDEQSPDTGCYGNKVIKTPNLAYWQAIDAV